MMKAGQAHLCWAHHSWGDPKEEEEEVVMTVFWASYSITGSCPDTTRTGQNLLMVAQVGACREAVGDISAHSP